MRGTKRVLAPLVLLLAALTAAPPAGAVDCATHPVAMPVADWCVFLDRFQFIDQDSPSRQVSQRVKDSMGLPNARDHDIRSYAFVVSIANYDFPGKNESELTGVKQERGDILTFLHDQGYDEAVVLEDNEATADAIRKIFTEYYGQQLASATVTGRQIRFLFLFDGHGWQPLAPDATGALALSGITDESDPVYDHRFSLAELRGLLQDLSPYTRSMLALLGSCYSGSVFPQGRPPTGDDFVAGPAAWIVAAAPRGTEAWILPHTGTVFYQNLFSVVAHWNGSNAPLVADDPASHTVDFSRISPRLSDVVHHINDLHELGLDPATGKPRYPPFVMDTVSFANERFGPYRFVAPRQDVAALATLPVRAELSGSSVIGRPDITIVHTPESYPVRGIDLSRHNIDEDTNFSALRNSANISFVYLKATQGTTFRDGKFAPTLAKVRAAGLAVGAYHSFDFCTPADDQLRNILASVPRDATNLPIALDIEWYGGKPGPGLGQCNPSLVKVRASLAELTRKLTAEYGKRPVYYLPSSDVADITAGTTDIPLWIANYSRSAAASGPSGPWTFWQFSGSGHLPGLKQPVDLNVFFGNEAQFLAYGRSGDNVALATVAIVTPTRSLP